MRITNNIILHNTSININGNKGNVDTLNNQMTSQKKIQRPSDDPVTAIRALRLRSTLSEIDQYYEKNIPDAESWLDVTETAITSMQEVIKTIRTQCEYGAQDSLTTDNRKTILTQLEKLRDKVYAEGNADYAGRTVFTGYRTNKKLTFTEDEQKRSEERRVKTSYEIDQKMSYADLQEHRYYGNDVTVPGNKADVLDGTKIASPTQAAYNRIRLGYDGIDSLDVTDAAGNTTKTSANGSTVTISYNYTDTTGTTPVNKTGNMNVTVYDSYDKWLEASTKTPKSYDIADGEAVLIRNTGEMVFSKTAADTLSTNKASLDISYTKTGFTNGELRPEYYYNCTNITDTNNKLKYEKYDKDGNQIYQDIDYVVAANQTLTVNTEASNVFDHGLSRDVDELIDAVQRSLDAEQKVTDLNAMKKMQEYSSDDCQAKLEEWIAAAEKERDYANDNMQKLYNSYIGNCDTYLNKVNLALTDVGSKGQSLALTKNRMSNEQETMEELKSKNEDRELSDIILEYTAAYTAYQSSLQAASKVNQVTLLSYL